jgi:hypothetical protein
MQEDTMTIHNSDRFPPRSGPSTWALGVAVVLFMGMLGATGLYFSMSQPDPAVVNAQQPVPTTTGQGQR